MRGNDKAARDITLNIGNDFDDVEGEIIEKWEPVIQSLV